MKPDEQLNSVLELLVDIDWLLGGSFLLHTCSSGSAEVSLWFLEGSTQNHNFFVVTNSRRAAYPRCNLLFYQKKISADP